MNCENRSEVDESNTDLSRSFAAACNEPDSFDFGFVSEREQTQFANFGVTEERHREIFAEHNVPYPGDELDTDEGE